MIYSTWRVAFWRGNKCLGQVYVRACCKPDAIAAGVGEWCEVLGRPMEKDIRATKL